MTKILSLLTCTLGPRLYAYFSEGRTQLMGSNHRVYKPNQLETFSDYLIKLTNAALHVGLYASPVLCGYMLYKRTLSYGMITAHNGFMLLKLATTVLTMLMSAMVMRGWGRYQNPEYVQFMKILRQAQTARDETNKRALNHYDFDFSAWPVEYSYADSKSANSEEPPVPYSKSYPSLPVNNQSGEPTLPETLNSKLLRLPTSLIAGVAMQTFGRRLVYPGTVSLLQTIMGPAMMAGRSKLVEEMGGMRYKLLSCTGHSVDTMFVDMRNSSSGSTNGDTLVIGCEGNGGFYEIGTIFTPLEAGYSVLGWNHPGYGGSTGIPYPDNEVAAIDVVVKFAIDRLGFTPDRIIMFGWSIGGFTASWAAMRYPKISGLVLDATFDNLEPLALAKMPAIISPITRTAIRQYFDLNNSRHVHNYDGPVLLIRRSFDEIISDDPANSMPTNRANDLLISLLTSRFPMLMSNERALSLCREFLAGDETHQNACMRRYGVNPRNCMTRLFDYFHLNRTAYPVNIGPGLEQITKDQLVLFLASKHLVNHDSVHTAPLPASCFRKPWDLISTALRSSNL